MSFHRDNLRFVGVIAILSVLGRCDLKLRADEHDTNELTLETEPGMLTLLRASRLVAGHEGLLCPDHKVENLKTPTRISMQIRDNSRPDELIDGFTFANWQPDLTH